MYSTVTEIHNAINIGTQLINSNRKRALQPPEIDVLFNRNILRFINNRTTSKANIKQEGFDDTVKRIMDLEELKTNTGYIKANYFDDNTSYITLPNNVKLPYGEVSKVYYTCVEDIVPTTTVNTRVSSIDFIDDTTGSSNIFYKDFKLTLITNSGAQVVLFDINNYYNLEPLYSPDAKFMIINMIMNIVNPNVAIYWEKYDDTFLPNKFIIVDFTNTYSAVQITYNSNVNITAQFQNKTNTIYNINPNITSAAELVSADKYNDLVNNFYYNKNRQYKPICKLEHGRIYINHVGFYPITFKLEYISTPIFINSFTGQNTNLRNNIEEIIDMTIEDIYSIMNGTYQGAINRNAKIE